MEDVGPRIQGEVNQQDDEPDEEDHCHEVQPALEVGDGPKDRRERDVLGEPEGEHAGDDDPDDSDEPIEHIAEKKLAVGFSLAARRPPTTTTASAINNQRIDSSSFSLPLLFSSALVNLPAGVRPSLRWLACVAR